MGSSRLTTPSLRVRLIATGMITWLVLVLSLDAFVYFSLRTQLLDSLDGLLDARLTLAQELAASLTPEQLDARLTELGVRAVVRAPDGRRLTADPAAPGFGPSPPGPITPGSGVVEKATALPDGVTITVFASRAGVDRTLEQVILLEAVGSAVVLLLMLVLLLRLSKVLLRPIDHVVVTAERIAGGRTGERLRPDRPNTELGRMAVAFDEMLDSLQEAVDTAQTAERDARLAESRSRRFLADAAHQLRTPVAALRALVDSLLRVRDPGEQERLLDNLARETARMSRLVSSLLRVAEIDRGEARARVTTDLTVLVDEEVARAREFAPNLEVEHRRGAASVTVVADVDSLREGVSNLLDNARRHATRRVMVESFDDGLIAGVRVGDDGPGLPAGSEEAAFERFVMLDGRGGSGLGLPIARGIARAHGGDLVYREGWFVLTLPRAGSPEMEPSGTAATVTRR